MVITLEAWQVALAASLIVINAVISVVYRLGMGRTLVIASVRTVVQLTAVGYLLEWIFALDAWQAVLPLLLTMTALAAHAAVSRNKRRFAGMLRISFVGIFLSSASVLVFAMTAVIGVDPWWTPRYIIPILGMILGNSLTGVSLGLDRFVSGLIEQRSEIELYLSHGATRSEAVSTLRAEAIRVGMIPIINAMMVVGTVSLPGMMTGQILSGTAPSEAVAYQIVVMFLLTGATALGTFLVVRASEMALFDARNRLLVERIRMG
jgi:putative ABC transport system permease protein